MYGLSDQDFFELQNKLIDPLKKSGADVYLFGSRATGSYKKFSDIDIFYVQTEKLKSSVVSKILIEFEDSIFPYKIDLVNYDQLAKSFIQKIDAEKIKL